MDMNGTAYNGVSGLEHLAESTNLSTMARTRKTLSYILRIMPKQLNPNYRQIWEGGLIIKAEKDTLLNSKQSTGSPRL